MTTNERRTLTLWLRRANQRTSYATKMEATAKLCSLAYGHLDEIRLVCTDGHWSITPRRKERRRAS